VHEISIDLAFLFGGVTGDECGGSRAVNISRRTLSGRPPPNVFVI
jgi:hypothetical protein